VRYINLRLLTYLLTYVVIRIRKIFSEAVGSAPRNAHVTSFSISKLMEVTHCRRTLSCPAPVFRTSSFGPPPPDHFSLANPKCATAPPNTIANSGHWPKCTHTHTHTLVSCQLFACLTSQQPSTPSTMICCYSGLNTSLDCVASCSDHYISVRTFRVV